MKLPRVRFTVRRMMAVVAIVAVALSVILHWDTDTQFSHGVGHVRIPIIFFVLDRGSGRPIEGATVRLRDRDYDSNPIAPYVLDLKTGPDGRATVLDDWMFNVATGTRSGRLLFYRVIYPRWEMTVTAVGYRPWVASFTEYEQGDRRFHRDAPPPPIVIRLQRQGPASRARENNVTRDL